MRHDPNQPLTDGYGRPMVAVPAWLFEDPHADCAYYLLRVEGSLGSPDGCHSSPSGVVEAMRLVEGINAITKRPDRRYVMLRVETVPELDVEINQESVDLLNAALARQPEGEPKP